MYGVGVGEEPAVWVAVGVLVRVAVNVEVEVGVLDGVAGVFVAVGVSHVVATLLVSVVLRYTMKLSSPPMATAMLPIPVPAMYARATFKLGPAVQASVAGSYM